MKLITAGYRDTILKYYDQIDIFSYYLDIPPEAIINCIQNKKYISNPLRVDYNPSLTFIMKNGKVRMMDSARREFRGDIFDIVGLMLEEDCNTPVGFAKIASHIIKNVTDVSHSLEYEDKVKIIKLVDSKPKVPKDLEVFIRDWEKVDVDYWKKFHIPIEFINSNFVRPIQEAYVNSNLYYSFTKSNPGYVYLYGKDADGKLLQKWYFPYEIKSRKHRTNVHYPFENIYDIKGNDTLLLIKATKDRLLIKYIINMFFSKTPIGRVTSKLDLVSLSSEATRIKSKTIDVLKSKYNNIFMYLDNDQTGNTSALYHNELGINVRFIPTGSYKDISDYAKGNSLKDTANLLRNYIESWKL